MANRTEVYAALDSEREYQNKRWGITPDEPSGHNPHSVLEWLEYIRHYAEEGLKIAVMSSKKDDPGSLKAREFLRKCGALAVAGLEQHGAPRREGF